MELHAQDARTYVKNLKLYFQDQAKASAHGKRASVFVGTLPAPPTGFADPELASWRHTVQTADRATMGDVPIVAAWQSKSEGDAQPWKKMAYVFKQCTARYERYVAGTFCYPGRCFACGQYTAIDTRGSKVLAARLPCGKIVPTAVSHWLCDAFEESGGRRADDGTLLRPHGRVGVEQESDEEE